MMHRVKATLPQLQPKDGIVDQAHTTINVSRREVGMASPFGHLNPPGSLLASLPEPPQMNGGKRAKREPSNASHLCLSQNVGLPTQGTWNIEGPAW